MAFSLVALSRWLTIANASKTFGLVRVTVRVRARVTIRVRGEVRTKVLK